MRAPTLTRPALTTDRTPVQDHEIAGRHVGHPRADRFDRARGLMTEQERELVVDPAVAVVQVGVAHPAGLDPDDGLTGSGIGDDDGLDGDRSALGAGDDSTYVLRHDPGR